MENRLLLCYNYNKVINDMGKAAMCIDLLRILSTGRVYSITELSDKLDTNPRNIYEYKKELEECGYNIVSKPGRYGGLILKNSNLLPQLKLTEPEKKAIKESYEYLSSQKSFMNKKEYDLAISKVMSSFNSTKEETSPIFDIEKNELIFDSEKIERIYNDLKKCITDSLVCEIDYIAHKDLLFS